MSDIETYNGKLTPVATGQQETIQYVQKYLKEHDKENWTKYLIIDWLNTTITTINDDWDNNIQDFCYDSDHYWNNNTLYKVSKKSININDGFFIGEEKDNGQVSFNVSYYNGALSFNDALDEVFDNLS